MEANGQGPRLDVPISAVEVRDSGFTVLRTPLSPEADVVFVHGFTGHPRKTWTCTKTVDPDGERPTKSRRLWQFGSFSKTAETEEVFWPQDLLPTVLPKARIISYGYDSNVHHRFQGSINHNTILDLGQDLLAQLEPKRRTQPKRPLIFVAHSLGGLVVKECLRKSEGCRVYQKHLHDIYDSTFGLMFFGTPHRGADPQSLIRSISENVVRLAGFKINDQLLNSLLPGSEKLTELREEFSKMVRAKSWTIYSFQEAYGIRSLNNKKVVDDVSSSLDDATIEIKQHIAGDHMEMCRFQGTDHPEFEKVAAGFDHLIGMLNTEIVDSGATSEQREACLRSLAFKQIDSRLINISRAHTKTCEWLFQEPEFQEWLDLTKVADHHGFLWIRGNPGVGKSTLMKYAFLRFKQKPQGAVVISYFFNARGESLEKSTIGMYRSLIFQLLEAIPQLQERIVPTFLRKTSLQNNDDIQWSISELQEFLLEILKRSTTRRFVFFIDALDESPEDEIRNMVEYFEDISQIAFDCGTSFNTCFSSRHFPCITIKKGKELTVERRPGHKDDIAKYVRSKLRAGKNNERIEKVRKEILDRASGVFLWVVLVVQSLNKAFDHGKLDAVQDRLGEIPNELHELFKDMLKRDTEDTETLVLLLQWILFARRPLTPIEVYFTTFSCEYPNSLPLWDADSVQIEDIERSIITNSKGLLQISKAKDHSVQFIHESVRDFLLDGGLVSLKPELSPSLVGTSHNRLKKCCYDYLSSNVLQFEPISRKLPVAKSSESENLRQSIAGKFPLIKYAVQNLFEHAETGADNGISQTAFLQPFCRKKSAVLKAWVLYNNIFEKYEIRRFTPKVRIIYILSQKGYAGLIHSIPSSEVYRALDFGVERHRNALSAAVSNNDERVVLGILDHGVDNFLSPEEYADTVRDSLQQPQMLKLLIDKCHDINISDEKGHSLLFMVASIGNKYLVNLMLARGADVTARRNRGPTALHAAARRGHEDTCKILLEYEAGVEERNARGLNALDLAAEQGHEATCKILLEYGANVNAQSPSGVAALGVAAEHGQEAVAKLLINAGANVNIHHDERKDPLQLAAANGSEAVVKLLLEHGANLEARRNSDPTPLLLAAERGFEAVVKLLLENGAKLQAKNGRGMTSLFVAVQHDHEAAVKLLLERGASTHEIDIFGKPAFDRSVGYGGEAVVKVLIENGAILQENKSLSVSIFRQAVGISDIPVLTLLIEGGMDVQMTDENGSTALHQAVALDHKDLVKFLLDKGAGIEARDANGQTALIWAASIGQTLTAEQLSDTKANPRTREIWWEKPWYTGPRKNQLAIATLLIVLGANLEAKDIFGMTPLLWAIHSAHEETVDLLLDHGADHRVKDEHGRTASLWAVLSGNANIFRLLHALEQS